MRTLKFKRIFLVDGRQPEMDHNERILEMSDVAERVLKFRTVNEALLRLVRPGAVPELLIAGEEMLDTNIADLMDRFAGLPRWVTDQCKVCLLLPELNLYDERPEYFHPLIYKTLRKPLCVFELMDEDRLIGEFNI